MQLGLEFGRSLRDSGQAKAAGKAGDEWMQNATYHFVAWLSVRGADTLESFREGTGRFLPAPASDNAWGALTTQASRRGLIVKTGEYRQSQTSSRRASMVAVWMAA